MRVTVDIEDSLLDELTRATGLYKKGPAIVLAVSDYVRKAKLKQFGKNLRQGVFASAFEEEPESKALLLAEGEGK